VTNGLKNSLYSKKSLAFFLTLWFFEKLSNPPWSPFSKGEKWSFQQRPAEKLSSLRKGGREGFLSRYFKKLN